MRVFGTIVCAMAACTLTASAQQAQYTVKGDEIVKVSSNVGLTSLFSVKDIKTILPASIRSKNSSIQSAAEYKVVDSLFNAFSYYGDTQTPFYWEPITNTLINIKRGAIPAVEAGSNRKNSSNSILIFTSTDRGTTWSEGLTVGLDGATVGAARYPSVNPFFLKTAPTYADLQFLFHFSETNGTDWVNNAFGYAENSSTASPTLSNVDNITKGTDDFRFSPTEVALVSTTVKDDEGYGAFTSWLGAKDTNTVNDAELNNVGVLRFDYNTNGFETPILPEALSSSKFANPGARSSRTIVVTGMDKDANNVMYTGFFGRFGEETARSFGVSRSTDNGKTWSELNVMPLAVINAYAQSRGWDETLTALLYNQSQGFTVYGDNKYSFVAPLFSNPEVLGSDIVEFYYDGSTWGVRPVQQGYSDFTRTNYWSAFLADGSGGATSASQKGQEVQLVRTADGKKLLAKYLEARNLVYGEDTVTTTDVVFVTRDVESNSWDKDVRNATQSDIMDRITWLPPVIPNDLNNIPLLTVQCADKSGETQGDILVQSQRRLASTDASEFEQFRQHVTISKISYSSLPAFFVVGIEEEVAQNSVVVAPNPSSDVALVAVESKTAAEMSIEIVDLLGNVVVASKHQTNVGSNYFNVNVSMLSQGSYTIRVSTNGSVTTRTLSVVK